MLSRFHRALLLSSAFLAFITPPTLGNALEARADSTSNLPAPLAINPDQNWDGIDGKWSSFTLGVGTPAQTVRTFLSFAAYQVWVVLNLGCEGAADPDECYSARGGTFDNTTSSTFEYHGIYSLWVGHNLGYTGNGITGFDTVRLGGLGENGPTIDNSIVSAFAVQNYWFGRLGINPKPTNFTDFNDPTPSLMTTLKAQGHIPSMSFGYTAGAHYRYTGTFASLTLGGYDTSKYEANNVTFIFAPDNERDVMVAIQSISTPSNVSSSPVGTELLPSPVYALIDSTFAELWLPLEACQAFEYEFGLVYDNTTELYLINDTHHEALVKRNASISFLMGQGVDSTETVRITLPYDAFDLQAQPPFRNIDNTSYYFPLRRAANDSQYTLGRTFLQEAYITVDYEVARFQLAQVVWSQTADENLVTIPPANASQDDSLWTSPNWNRGSTSGGSNNGGGGASSPESSSISGGAIAGIVVGAVAVIAFIAAFVFFCRRRQKRKRAAAAAAAAASQKPDSSSDSMGSRGNNATVYPKAELAGSSPMPFGVTHHDLDKNGLQPPGTSSGYSPTTPSAGEGTYSSGMTLFSPASEADSKQLEIYEMPGDMPSVGEKDGKQLSEKEALQHRERLYNGVESTAATPTSPHHDATMAGAQDPNAPATTPRRVNAEDIVDARTGEAVTGRHRAFSFEGEMGTLDSQ